MSPTPLSLVSTHPRSCIDLLTVLHLLPNIADVTTGEIQSQPVTRDQVTVPGSFSRNSLPNHASVLSTLSVKVYAFPCRHRSCRGRRGWSAANHVKPGPHKFTLSPQRGFSKALAFIGQHHSWRCRRSWSAANHARPGPREFTLSPQRCLQSSCIYWPTSLISRPKSLERSQSQPS
jgi:hypothetical protein